MINEELWLGKPYYSLDAYCKNTFHEKLYKIAIDAGMTCPNRDGTLDTRGCVFCSAGGSGDYSVEYDIDNPKPLKDQIKEGFSLLRNKNTGYHFIAYFQSFSNTYAPLSYLNKIFTSALDDPNIAGISIATRPDCISEGVLSLLSRLRTDYPDKFVWIELGLQTIHDSTAKYIRRGYDLSVFNTIVQKLTAVRIPVIVHLILGLPGETDEMILQSVEYLNSLPVWGIKLQLLHVLKKTELAEHYARGEFETLTKEHYMNLLLSCLSRLSPRIVIHRLTGDGPKDSLIAPLWSTNKRDVLNTLHKECKQKSVWQGKYYHDTGTIDSL